MPLDWRLRGTGIIFVLFYEWIVRSEGRQKAVSLLLRNKLNTLRRTVRTHFVVNLFYEMQDASMYVLPKRDDKADMM
jgi:hypothetical protein